MSKLFKYPDEQNERIIKNGLLFPLSRSYLEEFPQHYNAVEIYNRMVSNIPKMLEYDKNCMKEKFIILDDQHKIHFKIKMTNGRILKPNDALTMSLNPDNTISPGDAFAMNKHYTCLLIADIEYSYLILNNSKSKSSTVSDLIEEVAKLNSSNYISGKIPNGYHVAIPLMLGSKWDTMNYIDENTKLKSGEDISGFKGTFIIKGLLRNIIPNLKKPLNRVITLRNNYDEQLSRTELQSSKGSDYENSYYTVYSLINKRSKQGTAMDKMPACLDFGVSLQLNDPLMNMINENSDNPMALKVNSKKLINFIPLRIIFAAFGCKTGRQLIDYINPNHDSIALISAIRYACLYGPKHYEAYTKANIKIETSTYNYLKLPEELTQEYARYIIGEIIIKDKHKQELRNKTKTDADYRILLAGTVSKILNERFMPAIGDKENGSNVNRDEAICIALGQIFSDLYFIGIGKKAQHLKASLTNKRVRWSQQIVKEFKSFHNVRLNDIENQIGKLKTRGSINYSNLDAEIHKLIEEMATHISDDQSRSMIQSFIGTGVEQSKLRNEPLEIKNQMFVYNKINEIARSSDLASQTVNDKWSNRMSDLSELGFLDGVQSPDGKNTGKFKAIGVHTRVTISPNVSDEISFIDGKLKNKETIEGQTNKTIIEFLKNQKEFIQNLKESKTNIAHVYVVYLNGSIIGYIPEFEPIETIYNKLMKLRQEHKIAIDTSIVLDNFLGRLDIWTDSGRLMTIFVNVKNSFNITNTKLEAKPEFIKYLNKCNKENHTFYEGIEKGFIEFLCPDMVSHNAVIAFSIAQFYEDPKKYTHVSISSSVNGIVMANNSFLSVNAPLRASMSSNHTKQAIGASAVDTPQLKFMNSVDLLVSPQEPIVQPITYRYSHLNKKPMGQNITICMLQGKYNQEDSVYLNQKSVNSGLLEIFTLSTMVLEGLQKSEKFHVPQNNEVNKFVGNPLSYKKLNESSCLPKAVSLEFQTGDVLVGKTKNINNEQQDCSKINSLPDGQGTPNERPLISVEKHYIHENSNELKQLTTGQYRPIIQGDKVSSDFFQKGTVARIVPEELLPYTDKGKHADLYFNPLAILNRKTYSQLLYSILAKCCAYYGCILESSSYGTTRTPEEIEEILKGMNEDENGFEIMYDPETGDEIPCKMFYAPGYYSRQHHHTETKINVRNGGLKDPNYLMPYKGKKRHGGTTIDRLSNISIASSGAFHYLEDAHHKRCNNVLVGVCKICCGLNVYLNHKTGRWTCASCGATDQIETFKTTHASILLNHILEGLGIKIKVKI